MIAAVVAVFAVAGAVIAFVVSIGGSGATDEVEEAALELVTTRDPAACRELVTAHYLELSTHETGPAAVAACEREAPGNTTEDAEAGRVTVSGARATAEVELTRGDVEDDALELRLVNEGGRWKVDDLDRPSQADPRVAERAIVTTVLDYGSSEGGRGCEYLSYAGVLRFGGKAACERRFARLTSRSYDPGDANVAGATATIAVRDADRDRTYEFSLSRELGRWRIDSIRAR